MWLTRLALRNPVLILMISLAATLLGGVSLARLSVDLFPDITLPTIRVATFLAGAGPADVERTLTMPVERAVAAAPGIDKVESISRQGASVVTAQFGQDADLDTAQFEISQRLAQMQASLPPGVAAPLVLKFDVTNIPVVQVALAAQGLDERQLYELATDVIQPQLERVAGVASATVAGGKAREIQVLVQRDAIGARGLDLADVVQAIAQSSLALPSGFLREGSRELNVFSNAQIDDPRVLPNLVVRPGKEGAPPVRVRDVAEVRDAASDASEIVRVDGHRGVFLRVIKQPGANTIAVVDAVRAALPKLQGVPPHVELRIAFDQSRYIRAAVAALQHEALQGGLLAVLVLLGFLASVRATLIAALAIPLSVIGSFVLLYATGQTLNVFTLGGLALGVGRLVDDSIVELENIHRHFLLGGPRRAAVLDAAQEVAMPILVSTVTTVVVFVPVLFLDGVARELFTPLALTITFSLVLSFFVSRTVTPLLCLYALPGADARPNLAARTVLSSLDALDRWYAAVLRAVLRHRALTLATVAGACAAVWPAWLQVGTEFFPEADESQFTVSFRGPLGTRVERSEETVATLEAAVRKVTTAPDGTVSARTMISSVGVPVGRSALFAANGGPHGGNVLVNLVPVGERIESDTVLADRVRKATRDAIPGTSVFVGTGGIVRRIMNFGASAPVTIEILGHDLDASAAYARKVAERLREPQASGEKLAVTDVQVSREENYPHLDMHVDREKAGVHGISERQIAQSVLLGLVGSNQVQPVRFVDPVSGHEHAINVRLRDADRDSLDDLRALHVRGPTGALVRLDAVAQFGRGAGPVAVQRRGMQRLIEVTANVAPGVDLGTATASVERALAELPPPDGLSARLGGQSEAQRDAFAGLGLASLLAIALVYMVLAAQFESLLYPLVILVSVPLGIVGVVIALWLTDTTLSVNSFMGIIMMVGIVVSNGVLLVDFANVLRARGAPLLAATVDAGRTRLRPILMTTVATVVGLLPVALGVGEGSETNLPLARAVIGGLSVSTVFTLLLVPILYTFVARWARDPAQHARDVANEGERS
ncbi:MAG: efflux RND transporter permease subunit [Myxococcales bacterium]|nr:efflux RND transporter permease subunit [Myxococcales bacterium]